MPGNAVRQNEVWMCVRKKCGLKKRVRKGKPTVVVQDQVQTLTPLSCLLRSRPAHKISKVRKPKPNVSQQIQAEIQNVSRIVC